MFYQCPKCKKIWQYPVEKCLDCFKVLERLPSKKAKVIGISKVNIPTILHPQAPFFILVLEDENGNKFVQKSIKEYKIGAFIDFPPAQDKNAVAIWRVKYDTLETIEKVAELVGKLSLSQDSKILILPTLVAPKHPYFAVNTNPEFLESLINYLIQNGADAKNIKLAAQSFNEIPIEVSAQKSQLLDVCLRHKIKPLDLAKGSFVEKEVAGLNFEVSQEVFNSDLMINAPIMKLDSQVGIRGASENILKLLKKEAYLSKGEEMVENLQKVLPLCLTIADATAVQKSNSFVSYLGLILAGYDPLNLDRVFAEIVLQKQLPEYLKKLRIDDIPIVGRNIEEVQYNFERAH